MNLLRRWLEMNNNTIEKQLKEILDKRIKEEMGKRILKAKKAKNGGTN